MRRFVLVRFSVMLGWCVLAGALSAQAADGAAVRHDVFSYEAAELVRHADEGSHLVVVSGAMDTFLLGKLCAALRENPRALFALDLSAVSGVFELHKDALGGCENLVSLVIPDGLARVQTACFAGCDRLAAIDATAGNAAFSSARGILYDKAGRELVACPPAWDGTVEIPPTVVSVRGGAFACCPGVTAFALQTGDEAGRTAENEAFSVRDGILYSKDMTRLVQVPTGRAGRVTVPGPVEVIACESFAYCARVTAVELPATVRVIEPRAFSHCAALESVDIPAGVTSIGKQSFLWCTALGDMTIPAGVVYLGSRSFFKSSVTAVTFADTDGWTYGNKKRVAVDNPRANAEQLTHPGQYWFLDIYKEE